MMLHKITPLMMFTLVVAVSLPVLSQPLQPAPGSSPLLSPAVAAVAPTQPFVAPAPALPVAAAPLSAIQTAAEQRIAGLQAQLGITQAQATQWFAFAQVMRENAQTSDALFRQRTAAVPAMDAVVNLQSYAQLSRANAEGTEKLAVAFQALYATFSDQQRQAADTLFRQQGAQGTTRPAVKR